MLLREKDENLGFLALHSMSYFILNVTDMQTKNSFPHYYYFIRFFSAVVLENDVFCTLDLNIVKCFTVLFQQFDYALSHLL